MKELREAERNYPEEDRKNIKNLIKEGEKVEGVIRKKMDFFRRLQKFYENIKEIHQEQGTFRVISSSQIDEVKKIIDLRLRQVDDELRPEADQLEDELRQIHATFFQLEIERIREK